MTRYQIMEVNELSDEKREELDCYYNEDDLVLVDVLNDKVVWIDNELEKRLTLSGDLKVFVELLNEQEERMNDLERKIDSLGDDLRYTQRRVEYVHDAPSW